MLMHAQDPITLGDGGVVAFNGEFAFISDPQDSKAETAKLTRADLTCLMTANHELAHALAAVSVGCHIYDLRITPITGRTYRDAVFGSGHLGHVEAIHTHTPENAFVLLAGWAWETRYGIPCRAKPDYEAAKRKLTAPTTIKLYGDRWEEIHQRADAFVKQHEEFIMDYAIDLAMVIANPQGMLGKKALSGLNDDLRGYLGSAVRRGL